MLLEVVGLKDYKQALNRWADLLVKLGLTDRFGVYAERLPVAGMGIYLGTHDNEKAATRR